MRLTRNILAPNLLPALAVLLLTVLSLAGCGGGEASGNFGDDDENQQDFSGSPLGIIATAVNELLLSWLAASDVDFYRLFANTGSGFEQYPVDENGEPVDIPAKDGDGTLIDLFVQEYPVSVHLFDWTNALFLLEACTYDPAFPDDPAEATCEILGYQSARDLSARAIQELQAPSPENQIPGTYGISADISTDGLTLAVGDFSNSVFVCPEDEVIEISDPDEYDPEAYCQVPIEITEVEPGVYEPVLDCPLDSDTGEPIPDDPELCDTIRIGSPVPDIIFGAGIVYIYTRADVTGSFALAPDLRISAPNREEADNFGWEVSLANDGNLLAVSAVGEAGDGSSDQDNNEAVGAGAVYVYEHDPVDGWDVDNPGYLKAPNAEEKDFFGWDVELSGDAQVLAVSAAAEDSAGTDPDDNGAECAGAVYIFESDGNGEWLGPTYLKAPSPLEKDIFGQSLSLDNSGATLAIGMSQLPSREFLAGSPDNLICYSSQDLNTSVETLARRALPGEAFIFERDGNGNWGPDPLQRLVASNRDNGDSFGYSVSLNSDKDGAGIGTSLAVGAPLESSSSVGLNGNQGNAELTPAAGAAYLFEKTGASWGQSNYIKASNTGLADLFGAAVRLSSGGSVLAVGAIGESANIGGINRPQFSNFSPGSGAVYMFLKSTTSDWQQRAFVKAPVPFPDQSFGRTIDFADDGGKMVVTAPGFRAGLAGKVFIY